MPARISLSFPLSRVRVSHDVSTSSSKEDPKICVQMAGIRMTGAETFLRICSRKLLHAFLTMLARVADGVSENGSREFAHRSGNLICADMNILCARIRILYSSLWFLRTASGLCPVSLCPRHKPSPASTSACTLAGNAAVLFGFSQALLLGIPRPRISGSRLIVLQLPAALLAGDILEFRSVYEAGNKFGGEEKSRVPLYRRSIGGASPERSVRHIY